MAWGARALLLLGLLAAAAAAPEVAATGRTTEAALRGLNEEGLTTGVALGAEGGIAVAGESAAEVTTAAEGEMGIEEEVEGEEGEEEEEEEEEFTPVDINAAAMLLGGVTFVMCLFQLVNVDDDDVRRYAWRVISNTISIFMAVLFFQGNKEVLNGWATELGLSEGLMVVVHFVHCSIYLLILIFFIGWNSGVYETGDARVDLEKEEWTVADAMLVSFEASVPENRVRAVARNDQEARKSVYTDDHGLEVAVVKKKVELENRTRRNACWATLLAHMAGFAAIAAGGSMQQSALFRKNPALCFVPVLVTTLVLIAMFQGTAVFRERLRAEAKLAGRQGKRAALVHEAVGEAENDILSLAASFLTVQVCRFAITGQLPNEEGLEEPMLFTLGRTHVLALWGVGVLFCTASILTAKIRSSVTSENEEEESVSERVVDVIMNTCAMAFAWCILMGARWAWMLNPLLGIEVHTIDGRIMLAITLSLATFFVVYGLDKVDDALRGSSADTKTAERAIFSIITSVSVLVGFTWEHSFDGAVTAVADMNENHPRTTKFILGICVFAFLLRPWRRYILKKALQLDDLKKARESAKEESKKIPIATPTHVDQAPLIQKQGNGTCGACF
mmetsp:Transcript_133520/g.345616  ORF Transcript_133520/g.345616 Transcript_133520/m.345616 type:complete len:618 (-) Transcript_133520:95-1948(-)